MFINNKYHKAYYSIIRAAKSSQRVGYTEKHHIIPKSLGGSNDPENIVALTAREHFICHRLLTKMVTKTNLQKMVYAAWQLSRPSQYKLIKITSRTYESLRKQMSDSMRGRKRGAFSDEWKENMRRGAKNRKYTPSEKRNEHLRKLAAERDTTGSKNSFYGKTHSTEVRKILSQKNVEVFTGIPKSRCSCVICHKEVTVNTLHFHKKCFISGK